MKRKILVSLILASTVLAIGFGTAWLLIETRPTAQKRQIQQPPLVVETVEVQPRTIVEPVIGYGTAQADRYTRLSAQVMGEIIELPPAIKAGAEVSKGQLLLQIDPSEYRERMNQARSQLEHDQAQLAQLKVEEAYIDQLLKTAKVEFEAAQWEYDKVSRLYRQNTASRREYEQARFALEQSRRVLLSHKKEKELLPTRRKRLAAQIKSSQAQVDLARLNLEHCTIKSPFNGVVDELSVELGDRVQVGQLLVAVLDPTLIEVPMELPVADRPKVTIGSECNLTVGTIEGVSWSGTVRRIAPSADATTRTFKAYAEVNNTEHEQKLVPGFFVRAEVKGPVLENVIVLPRGVVQKNRVFIYNDGKAHPREVTVDQRIMERTVVTGLQPGQRVIISNLDALVAGRSVRTSTNEIHAQGEEISQNKAVSSSE
jgi:multidrug efflux pump subunit AcrA (membrane-fusion protein)